MLGRLLYHVVNTHLPFMPFAYRASLQESTKESPFYLLYRLLTALGLDRTQQFIIDLDTYKTEVAFKLSEA